MSAERPSTNPKGYWLSSTPGSLPPHAFLNHLSSLGLFDFGPEDFGGALPEEDGVIFPVAPGGAPQTKNWLRLPEVVNFLNSRRTR